MTGRASTLRLVLHSVTNFATRTSLSDARDFGLSPLAFIFDHLYTFHPLTDIKTCASLILHLDSTLFDAETTTKRTPRLKRSHHSVAHSDNGWHGQRILEYCDGGGHSWYVQFHQELR